MMNKADLGIERFLVDISFCFIIMLSSRQRTTHSLL
jgi:hypothetical protein